MIFGIDIKRQIRLVNKQYIDYINIKSFLDILTKDETNEEIKAKLEIMIALINNVLKIKKNDLHEVIENNEEEFIEDIKEHKSFYGLY